MPKKLSGLLETYFIDDEARSPKSKVGLFIIILTPNDKPTHSKIRSTISKRKFSHPPPRSVRQAPSNFICNQLTLPQSSKPHPLRHGLLLPQNIHSTAVLLRSQLMPTPSLSSPLNSPHTRSSLPKSKFAPLAVCAIAREWDLSARFGLWRSGNTIYGMC